MRRHDVIVMGASAGGLPALKEVVSGLPADLQASVLIVMHVSPGSPSLLPQLLSRNSRLPAAHPDHGDPIRKGRIYVAPPDRHLLIHQGRIYLSPGPRENRSRPALDPLFRSAAREFGPRVIGVVLTGFLNDGAAGLVHIKQCGGKAIVQDPREAAHPEMPRNALVGIDADYCVPLRSIPAILSELTRTKAGKMKKHCVPAMDDQILEGPAHPSRVLRGKVEKAGEPVQMSCPECHGPIWEVDNGDAMAFQCQVGHSFGLESFRQGQSELVERGLWMAVSALQDKAALARRVAVRMTSHRLEGAAREYLHQAEDADRQAALIRSAIGPGMRGRATNGNGRAKRSSNGRRGASKRVKSR